jgi:hypothetical protein
MFSLSFLGFWMVSMLFAFFVFASRTRGFLYFVSMFLRARSSACTREEPQGIQGHFYAFVP